MLDDDDVFLFLVCSGYRLCGRFAFCFFALPLGAVLLGSLLFSFLGIVGWLVVLFAEREERREGGAAVGAGKGIGEQASKQASSTPPLPFPPPPLALSLISGGYMYLIELMQDSVTGMTIMLPVPRLLCRPSDLTI